MLCSEPGKRGIIVNILWDTLLLSNVAMKNDPLIDYKDIYIYIHIIICDNQVVPFDGLSEICSASDEVGRSLISILIFSIEPGYVLGTWVTC